MALIEPATAPADQKPGPGLTLNISPNLSSNNPFRNPRTGSPALPPSPAVPSPQSAPLRHSTNPFLTAFEQDLEPTRIKSPLSTTTEPMPGMAQPPPAIGDEAKEMFKRLTIIDSPPRDKAPPSRSGPGGPPRSSQGRPSRPDENGNFRRGPNGLLLPARPPRDRPVNGDGEKRRARRSSEASVTERAPMTEEDRLRREKRRKERDARHREKRDASIDSKTRDKDMVISSAPRSSRRKKAHVDMVDKLDVTGLYGVGGVMHHGGPFDACRPDRNRTKDAFAPMAAFPVNSANNTIGGSGPLNKGINLEQFHGIGTEGFHDYGSGYAPTKIQPTSFNPTNRVEPIHGEETMGLGTSTFLEGAPASRKDIQRTELESHNAEGLGRKKSIAQRIRGMSQPRPRYSESPAGPIKPPEGRFQDRSQGVTLMDGPLTSPELPRPMSSSQRTEKNPFDSQYDAAYDKKGASVQAAEAEADKSRERALSSPKRVPIERRATTDNVGGDNEPKPSGFLSRVKSLKGPRRMKSERNPS